MKMLEDAEHLLNTAGFSNIFEDSRQLVWSFTLLILACFLNSSKSHVTEESKDLGAQSVQQ